MKKSEQNYEKKKEKCFSKKISKELKARENPVFCKEKPQENLENSGEHPQKKKMKQKEVSIWQISNPFVQ